MFNKIFKLILSTISISYAIYQITLDNLGNGIALIFLGLIFILLYFKNEILIIAFLKMRNQKFEATESWLLKIKNPESSLVKKTSWLL